MSDQNNNKVNSVKETASRRDVSLSQTILTLLDSVFRAQIHASRSFLSQLLQIGFPHDSRQSENNANTVDDGKFNPETDKPYSLDFYQEMEYQPMVDNNPLEDNNGNPVFKKGYNKISVPALTLIPIQPLAIDEANFDLGFVVEKVEDFNTLQESRTGTEQKKERPWYLEKEPISLAGNVQGKGDDKDGSVSSSSKISVSIKVGKAPIPDGVNKLITGLGQSQNITRLDENGKPISQ